MKKLYVLRFLFLIVGTVYFMDSWWTRIIQWGIVRVITLVLPTNFSGSVLFGIGFNALIEVYTNHPKMWKIFSAHFLSLPSEVLTVCPSGFFTAPNTSHSPSSNGCGADNLKIGAQYLAYEDQEKCCHYHDLCYDKCYAISAIDMDLHRTQCDLEFKSCLDWICKIRSWQSYLVCPFDFFLTYSFWNRYCKQPSRDEREKSMLQI